MSDAFTHSGLSGRDQQLARDTFERLVKHYPGVDQAMQDNMAAMTIGYVKEQAEARIAANQMELFTAAALREAKPIDREQGLQLLESLGQALQDAEYALENRSVTNDYATADDIEPWNRVDDLMESICRDPDALAVAAEFGFKPSDLGYPLLSERGTAFTAAELLKHVDRNEQLIQQQMSQTVASEVWEPLDPLADFEYGR